MKTRRSEFRLSTHLWVVEFQHGDSQVAWFESRLGEKTYSFDDREWPSKHHAIEAWRNGYRPNLRYPSEKGVIHHESALPPAEGGRPARAPDVRGVRP